MKHHLAPQECAYAIAALEVAARENEVLGCEMAKIEHPPSAEIRRQSAGEYDLKAQGLRKVKDYLLEHACFK